MQFLTGNRHGFLVCCVHNVSREGSADALTVQRYTLHYGINVTTVPLPHGAEAWLASQVPADKILADVCIRYITIGSMAVQNKPSLPFKGHMTFLDSLHVESDRGDRAAIVRNTQTEF